MADKRKRKQPSKRKPYHMTPFYSGPSSSAFWDDINSHGDMTLYLFGCALQEAEGRMLQALTLKAARKGAK